jgi:hypothetical protein
MILQAAINLHQGRAVAVVEWKVLVQMAHTVVMARVAWVAGIIFQVCLSLYHFDNVYLNFAGALVMYAAGGGGGGKDYNSSVPGGGPGAGSGAFGSFGSSAGRCF